MSLREANILDIFHELARWMARRQLHADIVVKGGSALVLQTYFRETASDMDMYFRKITPEGRQQKDLDAAQRLHLLEEFTAEHKDFPIDLHYARNMFERLGRGRIDYSHATTSPYTSYVDGKRKWHHRLSGKARMSFI